MKNRLSIVVLVLATLSCLSNASAQRPNLGGFACEGPCEPSAFQAVQGDLSTPFAVPGRMWIGANYADSGLGYEGSYVTIGAKTRLFEDFLDGRWLLEGRGHISENGGFFGNFGVERVFSLQSAGADLSLAAWWDYDDDQADLSFGETFNSWGVTGQIKTHHWDLIANGYFPFGTQSTALGDPTGANVFFADRIVVRPGIDAALEGFDVTLRHRPRQLAFVNGAVDIGGYGYEADLVDFFGGGRARLSFQMLRGWIFSGEINYDDRYNLTGVVGMTWVWGAGARGSEYAGIAADLKETVRNDHIVRFNQDVVYAIDPDTGRPYNVINVDNTATGTMTGDFETPFDSLADAEAASMDDDIIFVNEGDGTVTNYDTGIVLKDGQLFLGDGVQQLIPIQNGLLFELSNDQDGIRPRITTRNNGNAVTLANRNTVRGFIIDGNQASGGMASGIFGSGGVTNNTGIIEDNMILGAILDGVGITNLSGDWSFARNDIQNNGFNGIRLQDACDPDSVFTFDSNVVSNNGLDGIQITNYIAREIIFTNNVTNSNGRDGVRVEGFKGDPAVGVDILFDNHTARFNNGSGINIIDGTGSVTVMNSVIGDEQDQTSGLVTPGGNLGHGISITDFQTPGDDDQILIMNNNINGNGGGEGGVNIELNEGEAQVLITGNSIDGNGVGIQAIADDRDQMNGIGTILDISVVDNISVGSFFGGNISDGMRYIVNGGATMNVLVDQSGPANLPMLFNGAIAGNGISFLVGDDSAGLISNLNAVIRNVNIAGSGGDGIFGDVIMDGQLTLLVEDSSVGFDATTGAGGNGDGFDFTIDTNETGAVNSIAIRNVVIDNNVFSGFELNTMEGSLVDVALINNQFLNTFLPPARTDGVLDGVNPNGLPDSGFAEGILINAIGDAGMMNPQIDSRTRLFIQGNTIDRFTLDGIAINTLGDASVLATIDSNFITNNGDGFLIPGNTQPDLPFFDGISLTAAGSSSINTRITNNIVTGNAERGVDIMTFGASSINVELLNNNLAFNDFAEDPNNAIVDSLLEDFRAINGAGSTICLSLSNNVFALPDLLVNFSAMADFVVELDGGTNGAFAIPPGVTEGVFGSTCDPAITAEEMAYLADGFPPSPPPLLNP